MTRYLVQVAVGFAVGGLIAALGMNFSGGRNYYNQSSPLEIFLIFAIHVDQLIRVGAFSISGAIGGASLRKGWRPVIGFGLAGGVVGVLSITSRMWFPRNGDFNYMPSYLLGYIFSLLVAIPCGLAGAIGTAISGLGWRLVLAGAVAFGGAGGVGAIGASVLVTLNDYGRRPNNSIDIPEFLVVLVPLLITYAFGGALFALALEYLPFRSKALRRKELGLCIKCGYDLQGLPKHGHHCPECGTPFGLSVNKPLNSSNSLPPVSQMLRPYPRKK